MASSYRAQVATAFEALAEGLAPFVDARMSTVFPDQDWVLMAAQKLGKRRDVLVSLSDPHFQLEVINRWWGPAFAASLGAELRNTVTELRTARNHWAHPDPDHPFDLEYALRVHQAAEDVLRAVGSPEADLVSQLADDLRWTGVRDRARANGMSETEALMEQLTALQKQHDELYSQLEEARTVARTASGRQRAVARQLAELQSQYAAVSGLRDDYLAVQRKLEDERNRLGVQGGGGVAVGEQLGRAESALDGLQQEAEILRAQLAQARRALADVDPVDTVAGRRWMWLMTALVAVLGLLIAVAAYLPRS